MALSYNLGYQESISVHPTRRQNFAGKPFSDFPNIWEWLILNIKNTKASFSSFSLISSLKGWVESIRSWESDAGKIVTSFQGVLIIVLLIIRALWRLLKTSSPFPHFTLKPRKFWFHVVLLSDLWPGSPSSKPWFYVGYENIIGNCQLHRCSVQAIDAGSFS